MELLGTESASVLTNVGDGGSSYFQIEVFTVCYSAIKEDLPSLVEFSLGLFPLLNA